MNRLSLTATVRTESGKSAAKRMRKGGVLPAVMCNFNGESTMLSVNEKEFTKVWDLATPTTLVDLTVDGEKHLVFIKATHYDILSDRNLHVDFHEIQPEKSLKAALKILLKGTPVGVRQGGVMDAIPQTVTVSCMPDDLPVRIEADVDGLNIGDQICIKDLKFDSKVKVLSDPETVIAKVLASKK